MNRKEKKEQTAANDEILRQMSLLTEQLRIARLQFNQAIEPEIVDACVFEMNALQARYNYYLRLAREMGLAQAYTESGRSLAYRE